MNWKKKKTTIEVNVNFSTHSKGYINDFENEGEKNNQTTHLQPATPIFSASSSCSPTDVWDAFLFFFQNAVMHFT